MGVYALSPLFICHNNGHNLKAKHWNRKIRRRRPTTQQFQKSRSQINICSLSFTYLEIIIDENEGTRKDAQTDARVVTKNITRTLQVFINKSLRINSRIFWPKTIINQEYWRKKKC